MVSVVVIADFEDDDRNNRGSVALAEDEDPPVFVVDDDEDDENDAVDDAGSSFSQVREGSARPPKQSVVMITTKSTELTMKLRCSVTTLIARAKATPPRTPEVMRRRGR